MFGVFFLIIIQLSCSDDFVLKSKANISKIKVNNSSKQGLEKVIKNLYSKRGKGETSLLEERLWKQYSIIIKNLSRFKNINFLHFLHANVTSTAQPDQPYQE